jgi:thiol-disulfide isomerase/thioredoxin
MALRMRSPLPSLAGVETWLDGSEPSARDLDGPLLVHFWSLSCSICHDVAERVATWRDRYAPQGLTFIAVHQPRGPEELEVEKVRADALGPMGIVQPCAVDNAHVLVERFDNRFVPAYYLFDRAHVLRHFQAGDKGYDRIESAIERVLAEERDAENEPAA